MWRSLTPYERGLFNGLSAVSGVPATAAEALAVACSVRALDACGCIEFRAGFDAVGPVRVVAEGRIADAPDAPFVVSLTYRADQPLWLEFHRFGGDDGFFPPLDALIFSPGSPQAG